jgi:hypothetical protein
MHVGYCPPEGLKWFLLRIDAMPNRHFSVARRPGHRLVARGTHRRGVVRGTVLGFALVILAAVALTPFLVQGNRIPARILDPPDANNRLLSVCASALDSPGAAASEAERHAAKFDCLSARSRRVADANSPKR